MQSETAAGQGKPVILWAQGLGPLRRRRSRVLVSRLLPLVMEALSFGTASFDGDWRRLAMKKRKPAKGTAGWWSDQLAKEKRKAAEARVLAKPKYKGKSGGGAGQQGQAAAEL